MKPDFPFLPPSMVTLVPEGCPVCRRPNNAVTANDLSAATPQEGDLTICFGCGSFLTFNADLSQRELTVEEMGNLRDSERMELQRVRKAWVCFMEKEKEKV